MCHYQQAVLQCIAFLTAYQQLGSFLCEHEVNVLKINRYLSDTSDIVNAKHDTQGIALETDVVCSLREWRV